MPGKVGDEKDTGKSDMYLVESILGHKFTSKVSFDKEWND